MLRFTFAVVGAFCASAVCGFTNWTNFAGLVFAIFLFPEAFFFLVIVYLIAGIVRPQ
jgi:hypothetical protein